MKKYCVVVAGTVLIILVSSFKFAVPVYEEVSYPAAYRGWTHVKSTILGPQHPNLNYRGFNHVYANDLAMKDTRAENFLKDPFLSLKLSRPNRLKITPPKRQRHHMDVIQKDSLKFASTGGWGYAQFEGVIYSPEDADVGR